MVNLAVDWRAGTSALMRISEGVRGGEGSGWGDGGRGRRAPGTPLILPFPQTLLRTITPPHTHTPPVPPPSLPTLAVLQRLEQEGQLVQLPPLPHSLFPPPPPTLIPTLAVLQRFEQEGQSVELPRAHEGGICPGGGGRVLHEVVGWRLGWLGGIEVVGQQLGW